jgi:hypothetical protein
MGISACAFRCCEGFRTPGPCARRHRDGPVAALSFKVAVDDPRRFARSRTVGAHFGLTRGDTSLERRSTVRAASAAGRRCGSGGAMRGGRKPVATGPEMVGTAGLGPADRQEIEHAVRDRRGRAQACRYPAQDVGQRNRLPRRLRHQDHATIAIEACTVTAAGARKISAGVAPSMLKRS